MTLSARTAEREACAVVGCERHRQADSLFCAKHLADMWANRLARQSDGTFVDRGWRLIPKELHA